MAFWSAVIAYFAGCMDSLALDLELMRSTQDLQLPHHQPTVVPVQQQLRQLLLQSAKPVHQESIAQACFLAGSLNH